MTAPPRCAISSARNRPRFGWPTLALARVLMNEDDRDGAAREVRAVWQSAELSAEMESAVLETFHDLLTRAENHMARMRTGGASAPRIWRRHACASKARRRRSSCNR